MRSFITLIISLCLLTACSQQKHSKKMPSQDDKITATDEEETLEDDSEEVTDELKEEEPPVPTNNDITPSPSEENKINEQSLSQITIKSITSKGEIKSKKKENQKGGQVPIEGQKVKLLIKNNHSIDMWYIMPASGESTLHAKGIFHPMEQIDQEQPLLAKKYSQSNKNLVELIFLGKHTQSFRAFRVKANSSLLFRNYDMGDYPAGTLVPFWSAQNLLVNNKEKLVGWLPFEVCSTPNVVMHRTTEGGPIAWQNLCEKQKFPNQKIEYIKATGVNKYQIPVGTPK